MSEYEDEEKMAAAFTPALNRHPVFKGGQSRLPDKIQAGIIKKKLQLRKEASDTDSRVLAALSAEGGAAGMSALKKRVRGEDLQSSIRRLIAEGRVRQHKDGDLIKESASQTLGEGLFLLLRKPNLANLYNNLRSTKLQRVLQTEIPGTAGVHLPGMNKKRIEVLSERLSHPETALQVVLPGASIHIPLSELAKKSMPGIKKSAAATATKTDPQKWEAAKAEAKAKMGGKHSARAMQLATQIYKKKGGGYSGPKPTSSTNSLKKWTKQDWNWTGGDKPGQGGRGVYLPKQKADRLRESKEGKDQLAAAARKKSEATRKGEQYSSHGLAKNTSLKR